jgi:hypothetical protein
MAEKLTTEQIASLLPCPFCGGPANGEGCAVDCPNESCAGYWVDCTPEQWNRRTPAPPEARDDYAKICDKQAELHRESAGISYQRGEYENSRWAEAMADGAAECAAMIRAAREKA